MEKSIANLENYLKSPGGMIQLQRQGLFTKEIYDEFGSVKVAPGWTVKELVDLSVEWQQHEWKDGVLELGEASRRRDILLQVDEYKAISKLSETTGAEIDELIQTIVSDRLVKEGLLESKEER